jgi:hypothetical protein
MLSFGLAIGVGVAVVLCIGALVVLVLFGLRRYGVTLAPPRILGGGRTGADEKQEMEWDNSELNITVNPLDGEFDEEAEIEEHKSGLDVSICREEDELSVASEEEEEEKETPKCAEVKELEWDDSTLSY